MAAMWNPRVQHPLESQWCDFVELKGLHWKLSGKGGKKKGQIKAKLLPENFRGANQDPQVKVGQPLLQGEWSFEGTWLPNLPQSAVLPVAGWQADAPGSPWLHPGSQQVEGSRSWIPYSNHTFPLRNLTEPGQRAAGKPDPDVPLEPLAPPPHLRGLADCSLELSWLPQPQNLSPRDLSSQMHLPPPAEMPQDVSDLSSPLSHSHPSSSCKV